MADSCGGPITVTVTQTILQGAATSTTNAPTSPVAAVSEPAAIPTDQINTSPSAIPSNTDSISVSSIAFGFFPITLSDTTLTAAAPGTTLTLNLVHATPSSLATTTSATQTKATSTSSDCPKPTTSKASSSPESATPKATAPPGTIAGGVMGSMAGLALIIALLLWCCRRKRKITFKRTVKKIDPDQEQQAQVELESARQERDQAAQKLQGQNKPLPSPRSLDFGLPKIPHSTSPVIAQRWL